MDKSTQYKIFNDPIHGFITSLQAIYEDGALVSVAESSGVWFDLESEQPAPVPEIENVEKFIMDV